MKHPRFAPALMALAIGATHAQAASPDACGFFSIDEVNKFAKDGGVVRAEKHGSGAESQCNWLSKGGDNVMNLTLRESANATADLQQAVTGQQAMYKKPLKAVAGTGDEAWWSDNLGMLTMRKGNLIINLSFGSSRYGGEDATVAVAKAVAGQLK